MELTEVKARITKLIDEVCQLSDDVLATLRQLKDGDGSMETNVNVLTLVLLQGVLTTILSGFQNADRILTVADAHERTRGTGNITGLTF